MEKQLGTIAILRECKNKWERRCSLTPVEVKSLVASGIKVIVQPSSNRCFTEDEFEEAGAIIQEDISSADVIFGVKEVPIEKLLANKTYFMFSHTIKAQAYNMPLLDKFLELNIRLVDFECIREQPVEGRKPDRLVAFGRYAGIAGAFDFLRGMGEYLLEKQFQTPFVHLGSTYMYEDFQAMCEALAKVSKNIKSAGLPKALTPLVIAVTGTGRCASGSIEVLEQLPHVKVPPSQLREWLANPVNKSNNKQIVLSQFTSGDVSRHKQGLPFVKSEYYANPENFEGYFEEYLDCVSFLVNDIYWEAKYPRLITKKGLKAAVESGKSRFMGVTDISADYEGSIEFTTKFTSIEEPFLLYNPIKMNFKKKIGEMAPEDILFHSVDHLPAEMPKEASHHFGSKLLPFVHSIVSSDINKPFEEQRKELPIEIYNAIICAGNKLTPLYEYIEKLRALNERLNEDESSSSVGMQGFTLQLVGHLFDKRIFNRILDMFENNGVTFRVVSWQFGQTTQDETSVVMQGLCMNEDYLYKVEQEIIEFCASEEVKCKPVKGPSYEQPLPGHKDHL